MILDIDLSCLMRMLNNEFLEGIYEFIEKYEKMIVELNNEMKAIAIDEKNYGSLGHDKFKIANKIKRCEDNIVDIEEETLRYVK
jgi:hypothetical protein